MYYWEYFYILYDKIIGLFGFIICIRDFKKFILFKASEEEASRLCELNLLALVPHKFDFWDTKCPNYENIEF